MDETEFSMSKENLRILLFCSLICFRISLYFSEKTKNHFIADKVRYVIFFLYIFPFLYFCSPLLWNFLSVICWTLASNQGIFRLQRSQVFILPCRFHIMCQKIWVKVFAHLSENNVISHFVQFVIRLIY